MRDYELRICRLVIDLVVFDFQIRPFIPNRGWVRADNDALSLALLRLTCQLVEAPILPAPHLSKYILEMYSIVYYSYNTVC